jgi:hypothetical protein
MDFSEWGEFPALDLAIAYLEGRLTLAGKPVDVAE